eukprot:jgi/Tetstr1/437018/TSEL_025778.t1
MNAIDTAKGREAIQLLTPDEPARNWGKYLSDHIIDWDVQDKVSDEQAAARLDAITKFRAKVDDLGPTGFPRQFQDLFKEHIAATNTTLRSEAYRIKNQMPDLVISFFTEFTRLACAPELIAVSAPNVSHELWISMKAEALPVMPKGFEVDKDDKVAAAFSVWWDHMHPSYSFTHMNLKTILIDNQKTQIVGMKSRMTSWFKEKPWDETQRLRPNDFEKWPGLPLPMTVGEEFAERLAAEKRRQEAAERRGDYVIEDDDM